MKCVRKEPAEALAWNCGDDIAAIKFMAENIGNVTKFGKRLRNIRDKTGFPKIKGYFVLDNGYLEFYTEEEFENMYKPLEK